MTVDIGVANEFDVFYVEMDIDWGELYRNVYSVIMTGRFDGYFPDVNRVKSRVWDELRCQHVACNRLQGGRHRH